MKKLLLPNTVRYPKLVKSVTLAKSNIIYENSVAIARQKTRRYTGRETELEF